MSLLVFDLERFLGEISERVGLCGTVTVNREPFTGRLREIPPDELRRAAAEHRLQVVERMNGRSFDFTRLGR